METFDTRFFLETLSYIIDAIPLSRPCFQALQFSIHLEEFALLGTCPTGDRTTLEGEFSARSFPVAFVVGLADSHLLFSSWIQRLYASFIP